MNMAKKRTLFPSDFLWGAGVSSHQVEGNTTNQWSAWELAHAKQLAKTSKKRLSWIPSWANIEKRAQDPANYVSGRGVEHRSRYAKDFDLLSELNLNSFRFSIEWSRVQPEKDVWNVEAIEYYRQYIRELKQRGIEPILTLWHWTVPVWFEESGGFENGANLKYWDDFVGRIATEYTSEITYVLTLNEPNVYASSSYLTEQWPPGRRDPLAFLRVYCNLARAHKRAYRILKSHKKSLRVGLAANLAHIQAKRPHNLVDIVTTKILRYLWNWWFLNRVRRFQDFVGVNYYFSDYFRGFRRANPRVPLNDLGFYMEPEGLYPLLLRVWSRYKQPILITENGVADERDGFRKWWLQETILSMERAISEGVAITGYIHWSLLDNFEWSFGWWPKFGLVAVDRKNGMKRTIRPSARWFAERVVDLSSD